MARGSPRPRAEAPIPCPALPLPPRPASIPERDRAPTLPASFAGLKKTFAAAAATGNTLLVRVKDNQPRLHDALLALGEAQPAIDHLDTVDRHTHGREEHRRVEVFTVD